MPMDASVQGQIEDRVRQIEAIPSTPAVLLPLLDLLKAPPDRVKLEEVVRLVSYDNTIALQCLRVANSPLFGLSQAPQSIKSAVISLGLRRVETILLTCCLGKAFPVKHWALDPASFWRHSLGCALVCRRLSERLGSGDPESAYMAALLHDIGFLVNCLAFAEQFAGAVELACQQQIPLDHAELAVMGFTHCDTGEALARRWNLSEETKNVIAHHHRVESPDTQPLCALIHIGDLLCRMRGLGYGYYERQKVDLAHSPAWDALARHSRVLEGMDLARFTFEMDEQMPEICELVSTILGPGAGV
jgi:putative nucleotidyltransferase with HDIG domain